MSVNKLLFFGKERFAYRTSHLVSSGPSGHIHFWSVFQTQGLMARFKVVLHCLYIKENDQFLRSFKTFAPYKLTRTTNQA